MFSFWFSELGQLQEKYNNQEKELQKANKASLCSSGTLQLFFQFTWLEIFLQKQSEIILSSCMIIKHMLNYIIFTGFTDH